MDNLHLVTGYLGSDHITAMDQGAFNAALIGTGDFVLKKGSVFRAQVIDNNTVRVYDGELMMQGRFVRLEPGKYVDLTVGSGAQGQMRNDLIVARYTKNESTGVEGVNLEVIRGTVVASNPLDPDCVEGDITNGEATKHEFPLWRIPVDGLNVGTPVCLFGEPYDESMRTLPDIRNQMAQLADNIFSVAARIETGTYVGNGNSNNSFNTSVINPKLMIITESPGGHSSVNGVIGTTTIVEDLTEYTVYKDTSGVATDGSGVVPLVTMKVYIQKPNRADVDHTIIKLSIASYQGLSDKKFETLRPHCCFNADGVRYHYVIVGN